MKYFSLLLFLLLALAVPGQAATHEGLDLPALESLCLDYSPLIKQALAQRDAARARATQADSGFWPQLDASAGISNIRNQRNSSEQSQHSRDVSLNLTQKIFDYSLWFGSKSAGLQSMAYDEQVRSVHNDVLSQLRQAYFAVQMADKLLQVALEMHKDTEAFRDRARILMQSGILPQLDLARAEYDLAEAARLVIEARSALRKNQARLALVVGLDSVYNSALTGQALARQEVAGLDERELVNLALKFRPELMQFDYMAQAAEAAIEEARGGHFPVLSFQGNLGRSGDYDLEREVYSYGLYLDIPLFQGFKVYGSILEYQALHRLALQNLNQMRLSVREQTHVAFQDLEEAYAKVQVSLSQVQTAEENWRLMESRYQAGLATPLELSEARTNRFSAMATLASDQMLVLSNLAVLDRVVGGALYPFTYQRQGTGGD